MTAEVLQPTAMLPGLHLQRVHAHLREHLPSVGDSLSADLIAGGRSNLTYVLNDGYRRWVLRRRPLGTLASSAHDMGREFTVTRALQASAVPVPAALLHTEDDSITGAPFTVYDFVEGSVARSSKDLDLLSDDQVTEIAHSLVDVMAKLHAIDIDAVGLTALGRAQGYLARQVQRFGSQWDEHRTRQDTDVDALKAELERLCPQDSASALVHGDFRIDNAILSPGADARIRALVDWEMATLGDPLADLGLHLVYRDPRFAPVMGGDPASADARMPDVGMLARHYAARSGRPLDQLPFCIALSYFKAAVIADGIHRRYLSGQTIGSGFAHAGAVVPVLARAGLAAFD